MRRWTALCAVALAACHPSATAPDLAGYVPAGAVLIAGARLDALRASPLYARLPPSLVDPFHDASTLWAVFNGTDLLLIAQAGRELKLSGSQSLVDAANAQHRSGGPSSPDLLAQASAASQGSVLWIASRGNISLPLSGDAANLNRFLRLADFATIGLRLDAPAHLDFAAQCPTPDAAQHLEESLRAFLSLTALGVARQPELAALLKSAQVAREQRRVRASLTAPPEAMPKLFDLFSR